MPFLAIFTYDVKPNRASDFLAKLRDAASPRFNSAVMPCVARLYQEDTETGSPFRYVLILQYASRIAYEERTAYEQGNPEWRKLFDPVPDAPEVLVSRQLLVQANAG